MKSLPAFFHRKVSIKRLALIIFNVVLVIGSTGFVYLANDNYRWVHEELQRTNHQLSTVGNILIDTQFELNALKTEDQIQRNEKLEQEIKDINKTFKGASVAYEEVLKLKDAGAPTRITQPLDILFAKILTELAKKDYASGSALLAELNKEIDKEKTSVVTAGPAPAADIQRVNEAPGSGYRRQVVESDVGSFQVDVIAADLNSTRVVLDTASDSDCRDNCPVLALSDYVSRSGGFAGINGPYFCPADYPSCAGKTNSFDTLQMNKNKVYFNSENNVYSSVPAAIFSGGSARFVGQSSEWGRDTGVDAVIANQPLLLSGGGVRFGGDGDPKKGSRGARSFIGTRGSTVYIGVVRDATVAEVAHVLKTMGLENALNLDSGGSTALYNNGKYLAGPGRNTPFGIVLVRK